MYLEPFVAVFPAQGERETRVLTTSGYPGLPDDQYALAESYCLDPKCDCRRVMLNVVGRRAGSLLASVSFAFDPDDEMAGPYLDPVNPQSQCAGVLLALVSRILEDPAYVVRLESHYHQCKRAAADPNDSAYEMIRRIRREEERPAAAFAQAVLGGLNRTTGVRKKKKRRKW